MICSVGMHSATSRRGGSASTPTLALCTSYRQVVSSDTELLSSTKSLIVRWNKQMFKSLGRVSIYNDCSKMIQHPVLEGSHSLWQGKLQGVWLWTILQKIICIAWMTACAFWNRTEQFIQMTHYLTLCAPPFPAERSASGVTLQKWVSSPVFTYLQSSFSWPVFSCHV